jgi:hypothetical protein
MKDGSMGGNGVEEKMWFMEKMNLWGEDEAWERMGSNTKMFLGMDSG